MLDEYLQLFAAGNHSCSLVSEHERLFVTSRRAYEEGRYEDAAAEAGASKASATSLFGRDAARILANAYLRRGRTLEALDLVTKRCLRDRHAHEMLPLAAVAHAARGGAREARGRIELPIVFDIYTQHVASDLDMERVFALQEFLEARGVSRPSALSAQAANFERPSLTYLLRYLAIESVMDRSGLFSTSEEVVEERIAVCRLLVELDESESSSYHAEIKTLLRRLKVQRRMREIEQSKIYVDIDGIRRAVADEMEGAFSRYQALRRGGPPATHGDVRTALRKASEGDLEGIANLRIPRNETTDLLKSSLLRLRDAYCTSPEHGLDKYLSVRIRHGTLAAHLRRRVESGRLVTRRVVGSQEYRRNEYWRERLRPQSAEAAERVVLRLGAFSRAYDELIERIKADVHICTAEQAGLFDFTISEPQIAVLAEQISDVTTYDEFFDLMLGHLEALLDRSLSNMRRRILEAVRPEALSLLEGLRSDLEKYQYYLDVGELVHEVRSAGTDLQVEFERLAAWFTRAEDIANEPFALEDAIEIGEEAARTVGPDFRAEVESMPAGASFQLANGRLLAPLVDIFFVLFENVVRHSGKTAPRAVVRLEGGAGEVRVSVRNEVTRSAITDAGRRRVKALRETLDLADPASASKEGGSGLLKLMTLLEDDVGGEASLHFGFEGDSEFVVTFPLPWKESE